MPRHHTDTRHLSTPRPAVTGHNAAHALRILARHQQHVHPHSARQSGRGGGRLGQRVDTRPLHAAPRGLPHEDRLPRRRAGTGPRAGSLGAGGLPRRHRAPRPSRASRGRQHLPPPRRDGQDGRHRRPGLQRALRAGPRRRLAGERAPALRHPPTPRFASGPTASTRPVPSSRACSPTPGPTSPGGTTNSTVPRWNPSRSGTSRSSSAVPASGEPSPPRPASRTSGTVGARPSG